MHFINRSPRPRSRRSRSWNDSTGVSVITVQEAANRLFVSTSSIYTMCKKKLLRHTRVGARAGKILIYPEDVEAYRQRQMVEAQTAPNPSPLHHPLKHLRR